jgi:hypothetical protein
MTAPTPRTQPQPAPMFRKMVVRISQLFQLRRSSMKTTGFLIVLAVLSGVLFGNNLQAQEVKEFEFKDETGKHLDVLLGGRIVGRYMYAYDKSTPEKHEETIKAYLHVFDAEGKAPITNGAGGEARHQRGLSIGYPNVLFNGETHNFWHSQGKANQGAQVHQKFLMQEANASHAVFTSQVNWVDKSGNTIVEEERTTAFYQAPSPVYVMIDFTSKIKASHGDITLDGNPEHGGVMFRPADEIDRTKVFYTFAGEKVNPRTDKDLSWVGESFMLNGKKYSVVDINHPGNPAGAMTSAYRDYGRFGMFTKVSIKSGESITFKYRFLVAEGEMPSAELIQKSCNEFTGKSDPTPKTKVKQADQDPPPKPKTSKPGKSDEKKTAPPAGDPAEPH